MQQGAGPRAPSGFQWCLCPAAACPGCRADGPPRAVLRLQGEPVLAPGASLSCKLLLEEYLRCQSGGAPQCIPQRRLLAACLSCPIACSGVSHGGRGCSRAARGAQRCSLPCVAAAPPCARSSHCAAVALSCHAPPGLQPRGAGATCCSSSAASRRRGRRPARTTSNPPLPPPPRPEVPVAAGGSHTCAGWVAELRTCGQGRDCHIAVPAAPGLAIASV